MKGIFIIDQMGEPIVVQSQKAEGGKLYKCTALFREMGERHGDVIMATLLGVQAKDEMLKEGDVVIASIRFSIHEHNGQTYQDAVVGIANILATAGE